MVPMCVCVCAVQSAATNRVRQTWNFSLSGHPMHASSMRTSAQCPSFRKCSGAGVSRTHIPPPKDMCKTRTRCVSCCCGEDVVSATLE